MGEVEPVKSLRRLTTLALAAMTSPAMGEEPRRASITVRSPPLLPQGGRLMSTSITADRFGVSRYRSLPTLI
ncbi:MAG: hypothetical protein ACREP7_06965 [Lysobacter sp.]